jgi:broad specificity phosphatase PhoE
MSALTLTEVFPLPTAAVTRTRDFRRLLLFTSGHFIRVLAALWLGLEPTANGGYFMLSRSSLSALGYEKDFSQPVVRFWNDTHPVDRQAESAV